MERISQGISPLIILFVSLIKGKIISKARREANIEKWRKRREEKKERKRDKVILTEESEHSVIMTCYDQGNVSSAKWTPGYTHAVNSVTTKLFGMSLK